MSTSVESRSCRFVCTHCENASVKVYQHNTTLQYGFVSNKPQGFVGTLYLVKGMLLQFISSLILVGIDSLYK